MSYVVCSSEVFCSKNQNKKQLLIAVIVPSSYFAHTKSVVCNKKARRLLDGLLGKRLCLRLLLALELRNLDIGYAIFVETYFTFHAFLGGYAPAFVGEHVVDALVKRRFVEVWLAEDL